MHAAGGFQSPTDVYVGGGGGKRGGETDANNADQVQSEDTGPCAPAHTALGPASLSKCGPCSAPRCAQPQPVTWMNLCVRWPGQPGQPVHLPPGPGNPKAGAGNPGASALLGGETVLYSLSRGLSGEVSALPIPGRPPQRPGSHTRPWPPPDPQGASTRRPGRVEPGCAAQRRRLPHVPGRGGGTRASFTARGPAVRGTGAPTPGPAHVAPRTERRTAR